MIQYKTLNNDHEITEHLNDGWELYGSPCVMPSTMSEHPMGFFQAITKFTPDNKPIGE